MTYQLVPVDQPAAPSLAISARLRSQLVYFMTPPDEPHVPPLQPTTTGSTLSTARSGSPMVSLNSSLPWMESSTRSSNSPRSRKCSWNG